MKSYSTTALILKRSDIGEADRIVTLLSREHGKLTAIAKGCRKLTSSKLSSLEPAMLTRVHLVSTHGLPILTQSRLIDTLSATDKDLRHMRKVFEVLEMVDSLMIDEDAQPEIFDTIIGVLNHLSTAEQPNTLFIRNQFLAILQRLGFVDDDKIDVTKPLKDFVEEVTQKKLKAYSFLQT